MTTRTSSRLSYRASCGPSLPLVSLPLVLLMLTAACSPTSDDAAPAAVDSGGGGDGAMDRPHEAAFTLSHPAEFT